MSHGNFQSLTQVMLKNEKIIMSHGIPIIWSWLMCNRTNVILLGYQWTVKHSVWPLSGIGL